MANSIAPLFKRTALCAFVSLLFALIGCASRRTIFESWIPTSPEGRPVIREGVLYFLRRVDQSRPIQSPAGEVNERAATLHLCALEIATGRVLWMHSPEAGKMPEETAFVGESVAIAGKDGWLYVLNLKSGAEKTKIAPPQGAAQGKAENSAAANFVALPGGIIQSNGKDAPAWTANLAAGGWQSDPPGFALEGDVLYATCVHRKGIRRFSRIHALDPKTGRELWRETFERDAVSAPTIAEGVLYLAGSRLYAIHI